MDQKLDEGYEIREIPKEDLLNPEKAPTLVNRMANEFPEKQPSNKYYYGIIENFSRVFAPDRYQNRSKRISAANGRSNNRKNGSKRKNKRKVKAS